MNVKSAKEPGGQMLMFPVEVDKGSVTFARFQREMAKGGKLLKLFVIQEFGEKGEGRFSRMYELHYNDPIRGFCIAKFRSN